MKRSDPVAKKKILAYAGGVMLLIFSFFMRNFDLTEENIPEEHFKGIIRLYDLPTTTVMGNDFSVISTICEEFSDFIPGGFVRLEKISEVTKEESYGYAAENADIIRYSEELDKSMIMTDIAFTSTLRNDLADVLPPYSDGKVVVPLWYDVCVLLINSEFLSENDIKKEIDHVAFSRICEEYVRNEKKIYCSDEKVRSILSDIKYPSYIDNNEIFEVSSEKLSAFSQGEEMIYIGSLKDAAYLVRQESRGKEVIDYELQLLPGVEEAMYILSSGSYAAKDCEDDGKRDVLLSFMAYLQEYGSVRYTENLGYLPWVIHEEMTYEKYPYLKEFALFEGRRIVVE